MSQPGRVYRSVTDRKIWGVCGGLGEFFMIDPVWVRIVFVVLVFVSGVGLLLYFVLALVMPNAPSASVEPSQPGAGTAASQPATARTTSQPSRPGAAWATIAGVALIVIGILVLLGNLAVFSWFKLSLVGPLVLSAAGLLLLLLRRR
ncbi:MAG: PspC domain-containing protein [Chloroflexi bacterium]|nr:PspC domain-containing protein [Chloroflexota bacterium]